MSWVQDALKGIRSSESVYVRPRGGSMSGIIEDNELVQISGIPINHKYEVGQVVFVKWKGNYLLHLINQVNETSVQIRNNKGKVNGWVSYSDIIGWCPHKSKKQ
jgi:Rieske Fe-S protein